MFKLDFVCRASVFQSDGLSITDPFEKLYQVKKLILFGSNHGFWPIFEQSLITLTVRPVHFCDHFRENDGGQTGKPELAEPWIKSLCKK
jgi:hypothetical protein